MLDESDRGSDRLPQQSSARDFFDEQYAKRVRYWWRVRDPYSPDPEDYPTSLLTQATLRLIAPLQGRGSVLDLGAGEGADAIRLAKLGYDVTAVEISKVGAEKIRNFAQQVNAQIKVETADVTEYRPDGLFDLIICNGVLHYVSDKEPVIAMMQRSTRPGGLNVISVWSTFTEVPGCHREVPVFPDDETGDQAVLARLYRDWPQELWYFDRDKRETAHDDMAEHAHSHIKMIARRPG
jgi:SAM-dependent methyltransferase